jgi:zinc protease
MRVLTLSVIVATMTTLALGGQTPPDRSSPPPLGPTPVLDLPAVEKRTLSNGLRVWLIESREVPLVQLNLVVLAGAGDDPAGKAGAGALTAAMLDEGAGARDALAIADDVERLGGVLSTSASYDASAVRLNVPAARLEQALPIMGDVVMRPTFPDKELARVRQEWMTSLLQARDDPSSLAAMSFARVLFGAQHRYGTGTTGTETTLQRITTADLRAFHGMWYQPAQATLIAVGDFDSDRMMRRLESHFGAWAPTASTARAAVPTAPQVEARHVTIVDMPGAAQSQIRIGWIGVSRATPDFFTLQLLNTILGGSFTSRLNQNLRETHGYTYGASSRFDMRLSAGAFLTGAGVQTDKTAEALREFFNELQGIVKPVPADELRKAKNYITLRFPAQFETAGDLAARLEELVVYGLPDDYFERYTAAIEAVTADDIARAAATYIQPQRAAVVVVGDRKVIEPGIRALNLGPIRAVTPAELLPVAEP